MCSCPSTRHGEHRIAHDSRNSCVKKRLSGRSRSLWTDPSRPSDTGFGAGTSPDPMPDGRGSTPRRRRARSCESAHVTGERSSASTFAALTGAFYAPRSASRSAAAKSSGSWSRRPAAAVQPADMTGRRQRCSSTTSIPRRSRSGSPPADSATGLIEPAKRPESACSSAGTATPKWREEYVGLRLPGVDSNHQELINSQSCCRYITGERRCRA
jgi:hypothetical protein